MDKGVKQMKRIIRYLLIAIVVAALASVGYWAYRNQTASAATSEDGTYTQVVTVEQGNLSETLSVVGSLEAVQSADLAFDQMSGTAELHGIPSATGAVLVKCTVTVERAGRHLTRQAVWPLTAGT